jgi:PiT family inorganic phosphate transporter
VLAGLLGGIFWNLITWSLGLPSSSSHALIGGVVGAVLVAAGWDAVLPDGLVGEVLAPAVAAPLLALGVAEDHGRDHARDDRQRDPSAAPGPRCG